MAEDRDAALRRELERLTQIPPFRVDAVDDSTGELRPWFYGSPADLFPLQFVDEMDRYRLQAATALMIARWSRAAAATKRAWQVRDRQLREWKSAQTVALSTPPPGAAVEDDEDPKSKKKGWKAPPQWQVEASYRAMPDYTRLNVMVEQAEEAHQSCLGVLEGWQAVKRLLAPGE